MNNERTPKEKAREYLAFVRADDQPHLGSPWEVVQDAVDRDPEEAWEIILSAIAESKDGVDLSFVGTGPLESLLVHHGEYLVRALDAAKRDLKFREALRSADIRGGAIENVTRLDDFFERLDATPE